MFVVVTKIDMCPANVLQDTMKLLIRVLKSPGCRKIPVLVQNKDDVITSAANFTSERYIIFNIYTRRVHVLYNAQAIQTITMNVINDQFGFELATKYLAVSAF